MPGLRGCAPAVSAGRRARECSRTRGVERVYERCAWAWLGVCFAVKEGEGGHTAAGLPTFGAYGMTDLQLAAVVRARVERAHALLAHPERVVPADKPPASGSLRSQPTVAAGLPALPQLAGRRIVRPNQWLLHALLCAPRTTGKAQRQERRGRRMRRWDDGTLLQLKGVLHGYHKGARSSGGGSRAARRGAAHRCSALVQSRAMPKKSESNGSR